MVQSEKLFKCEKNFHSSETFNSLVERLRELLRRLSRLDSFVTTTTTQPGEFKLINKYNIINNSILKPFGQSSTNNKTTSHHAFLRQALPSFS